MRGLQSVRGCFGRVKGSLGTWEGYKGRLVLEMGTRFAWCLGEVQGLLGRVCSFVWENVWVCAGCVGCLGKCEVCLRMYKGCLRDWGLFERVWTA